MDLSSRKLRLRLAAAAAFAGIVFVTVGFATGYATVWLCLGTTWLLVAALAFLIGFRWR